MGFLKNYRRFSTNSSLALSSASSKQNEIKQTAKSNLWMMQSACVLSDIRSPTLQRLHSSFISVLLNFWSWPRNESQDSNAIYSTVDANVDRLHQMPSSSEIANYSMQSAIKCHLNVKLNTGILTVCRQNELKIDCFPIQLLHIVRSVQVMIILIFCRHYAFMDNDWGFVKYIKSLECRHFTTNCDTLFFRTLLWI